MYVACWVGECCVDCFNLRVLSRFIFWAQVLSESNTQVHHTWLGYSWGPASPGTAHFALST